MTTATDLLLDSFARVRDDLHAALDGLDADQLAARLDPEANSVAWLAWHLTRVQDDHVADVAGRPQVYLGQGWSQRFALPFDDAAVGYGQTSDEVGAVRVDSAELLTGYYDAVHEQTLDYVKGLSDDDFLRIVDTRWDPPVTLAVRLVSVVNDCTQHVGQAAFLRGVLLRR